MTAKEQCKSLTPALLSLVGSFIFLVALFSPLSKPWLLHSNIDWFFRFWIYFQMLGSAPSQDVLTTSNLVSDWLQFSPYGLTVLVLRIASLSCSTICQYPPTVGFAALGITLFVSWVWLWWLSRNIAPFMLCMVSLAGLFIVWWSPVILSASLVIPIIFQAQRANWLRPFLSIFALFVLFPSLIGLISTVIALASMFSLLWKNRIIVSSSFNIWRVLALLAVGISSTLWLQGPSPLSSRLSQVFKTESIDTLAKRTTKYMMDYSRERLQFPQTTAKVKLIPIERFQLEQLKDTIAYLSYFFSADWGDSFDIDNSPNVAVFSNAQETRLRPTWEHDPQDEFTYQLSYSHIGKLVIAIPRSLITSASLGWVEITR